MARIWDVRMYDPLNDQWVDWSWIHYDYAVDIKGLHETSKVYLKDGTVLTVNQTAKFIDAAYANWFRTQSRKAGRRHS